MRLWLGAGDDDEEEEKGSEKTKSGEGDSTLKRFMADGFDFAGAHPPQSSV